jgi:hypothetical protein
MRKLLCLLVVVVAAPLSMPAWVCAQGGVRGEDPGFEAAQRSVENQLMVEEMENAGFELDVEEGFDEEWEEDLWVGSEPEDVDPLHVDPSEAERFDLGEVPRDEEIASDWSEDSWENPDQVLESHEQSLTANDEEDHAFAEGAMRGDSVEEHEDIDIAADLEEDLLWEEETETAELNWWEEDDSQWEELIDDMEMDAYDEEFEVEEDLDLLEELYNRG